MHLRRESEGVLNSFGVNDSNHPLKFFPLRKKRTPRVDRGEKQARERMEPLVENRIQYDVKLAIVWVQLDARAWPLFPEKLVRLFVSHFSER